MLLLTVVCAAAFAEQPRIDVISPSEGPIAGGTIVTITGASLSGVSVTIDGVEVTPIARISSMIQLQMPRHDNGYALIQIGSAAAEFLYIPPKIEDLPPGFITTVAGIGKYIRVEFPATQSMLNPWDVTVAPNGDLYFMQTDRGLLFRITADGILHHVAGSLGPFDRRSIGDNGPAKGATFLFPRSVAVDAAGNCYITDNARIRKVDARTGIVTTVAGTGEQGFSGDGGPATSAKIGEPSRIAAAPDGTLFYIDGLPINGGNPLNLRVRQVKTDGTITTLAGNGTVGEAGDNGPATAAQLNIGVGDSGDIAVDADRNVFILEHDGARIRRVDAKTGIITTFASLLFPAGDPRNDSAINPAALATDASGNVWAATAWNIKKFDPSGKLLLDIENGPGFSPDGTAAIEMLNDIALGMTVAANGDVIYSANHSIRKINAATGKLETIAGIGGRLLGVPGRALAAVLGDGAGGIAFLPDGNLISSAATSHWMLRIDLKAGTIAPFGGTGSFAGRYEDAPASETALGPSGIAADPSGRVYTADTGAVRSIDPDGVVRRVAGIGGGLSGPPAYDFAGDGGPATAAHLCQPWDVALDRNRNVYIADTNNNRIRRVDANTGIITTVAGSGPTNGFEGYGRGSFCGDGGPAVKACLNSPIALTVTDDLSIYINDNTSHVRKITPDGIISSLSWPQPTKMIARPGGSIFVHNLWRVYRADHDHVRFIAGQNTAGFAGDGGPAADAMLAP
ncbi:MAG TPA: IPT/TIG domain-containing protein, partial [Thermoanaerobaculia bacterium]